jgi:hypothetical protein
MAQSENRILKLTLRDLFWLVLVVAMGLGWSLDHRKMSNHIEVWKAPAGGVQQIMSANLYEPSKREKAARLAEAIQREVGPLPPEGCYVGPEGDYLRLRNKSADVSISWADTPVGLYSVQICLGNDPLDIVYDDECGREELIALCRRYLVDRNP